MDRKCLLAYLMLSFLLQLVPQILVIRIDLSEHELGVVQLVRFFCRLFPLVQEQLSHRIQLFPQISNVIILLQKCM